MTKQEKNSFSVTPNSGRKKGIRSNNKHKNRVEFRVPGDELWIYESVAKSLFENGYIRNPTLGEAARFSFSLYARDYLTEGDLLTMKLSEIIPIKYYDKLLKERDFEKQQRILYEKANETFASSCGAQSQTVGKPSDFTNKEEGRSQWQTNTTDVRRKNLWKGQFIHFFPGLMIGESAVNDANLALA